MIKTKDIKKPPLFIMGELIPERQICKSFGCSKKLTLLEQLFSDKCATCTDIKKMDVMQVLKIK